MHLKVITKKDNTIENHENLKKLKLSEERELKIKEKKLNKKAKILEERENKIGMKIQKPNSNNNEAPKSLHMTDSSPYVSEPPVETTSHELQHMATKMVSMSMMSSSPSSITHWMPVPLKLTSVHDFPSSVAHRVSSVSLDQQLANPEKNLDLGSLKNLLVTLSRKFDEQQQTLLEIFRN